MSAQDPAPGVTPPLGQGTPPPASEPVPSTAFAPTAPPSIDPTGGDGGNGTPDSPVTDGTGNTTGPPPDGTGGVSGQNTDINTDTGSDTQTKDGGTSPTENVPSSSTDNQTQPTSNSTRTRVSSVRTWVTSTRSTPSAPTQATVGTSDNTAQNEQPTEQTLSEITSQYTLQSEDTRYNPVDASESSSDRTPSSVVTVEVTTAGQTTFSTIRTLPGSSTVGATGNTAVNSQDLSPGKDVGGGMSGAGKAGIAIGILVATAAALIALHYLTRYYRAKQTHKFFMRSSYLHAPARGDSAFSWHNGEGPDQKGSSQDAQPPQDRPTSPSNGFSNWGISHPPLPPVSPVAVRQVSANFNGQQNLRISVVAPSIDSNQAAFIAKHNGHSRASSQLSGNHLHPTFKQHAIPTASSTPRSRESIATSAASSGERSPPLLSRLASQFPMPRSLTGMTASQSPTRAIPSNFASNNPFRTSDMASTIYTRTQSPLRPYSATADSEDGGKNPFEFEFEHSNLEIDFTKIGVTPVNSGHTTLNPTTPITPANRRGSASSLSIYSVDHGNARPINPFSEQPISSTHTSVARADIARDSLQDDVLGRSSEASDPWAPLGLRSGESSRKPSFSSHGSGLEPSAWADEVPNGDKKTYSRILDMYAGRAM